MIKKLILSLLVIFLFIGSSTAGGISVTPATIDKSGPVTVTNTGDKEMVYIVSLSQVMLKDGTQTIIENVKADIQVSESKFSLKPGESKILDIIVGDTGNKLYGVSISENPAGNGILVGLSTIVKVDGVISTAIEQLTITPKYLPVGLGGVPVVVNYDLVNNGNIPVTMFGKNLYPGDNANIEQSFDTGFLDFGFKEFPHGVKVFIIPSPLLLLILIGGVIVILRRKVEINLK